MSRIKLVILLLLAILTASCKSIDEIRSTENMLKEKGSYKISLFECSLTTADDKSIEEAQLTTKIISENEVPAVISNWSYFITFSDGSVHIIDEEDYKEFTWDGTISSATEFQLNSEIRLKVMESVFSKGTPVNIKFRGIMQNKKSQKSVVESEITSFK